MIKIITLYVFTLICLLYTLFQSGTATANDPSFKRINVEFPTEIVEHKDGKSNKKRSTSFIEISPRRVNGKIVYEISHLGGTVFNCFIDRRYSNFSFVANINETVHKNYYCDDGSNVEMSILAKLSDSNAGIKDFQIDAEARSVERLQGKTLIISIEKILLNIKIDQDNKICSTGTLSFSYKKDLFSPFSGDDGKILTSESRKNTLSTTNENRKCKIELLPFKMPPLDPI